MKSRKFFAKILLFVIFFQTLQVYAEVPLIPATSTSAAATAPKIQSAATAPKVTSQPKPPTVTTSFENCVKIYQTSIDNLFYLTLAAINASGYKIDEIQSKTGYISFLSGSKTFLISITKINNNLSMIKITPADNSYAFSPYTIEKIFNYLTNNIK